MRNYIELIREIYSYGTDRQDRTGVGSRYIWGNQLSFPLTIGFPATTIRPVPLRWVFEETMFFLRGETQTKKLEEKKITIWKKNTTREFLDERKMKNLHGEPWPVGDMGRGYGFQWRKFGADAYNHFGIDQLQEVVSGLMHDPLSRRHLISAWNPVDLPKTALPPCHVIQHYYIDGDQLNSSFWMRSNDVIYGLPFNIAQYAFINLFFAKLLRVRPGKLVYQCSDAHIYTNQLPMAKEMLDRYSMSGTTEPPQIKIHKDLNCLDDILALEWRDIEILNYHPHPDFEDKPEMAA